MSDRRSRTVGRGLALLGAALLALAACASLPSTATLPERHPEGLDKGRAVCTDCHDAQGEITYSDFNHRNDWASAHRLRTYGQERVCAMCHRTHFCNDCHALDLELKPSIRQQSETYREMPHRGDYVSRHRIDARIDPSSCFRCHGSPKTSKSCAACHG